MPDESNKKIVHHRWAVIGLIAVVLLGVLPLLLLPDVMPCKDDAEGALGLFEGLRKSILEYGEFPFWSPWGGGGVPLFADNNAPLFAVEMPCVLLFGTFYGIRVAIFLYGLIAAFGTYVFLGDYTENRLGRFYGACIFALMGGFSLHNINGHEVFLGFCYLPWLLWFVHHLWESRWLYGAGAGLTAGLLINHEIHYPSLFSISTACVFALPVLFRHAKEWHFWRNVLMGAAMTLAVGGYRLVATGNYLGDYPREMSERMIVPITHLIRALVVPCQSPKWLASFTYEIGPRPGEVPVGWEWHELGCYIGCIALFFMVLSMMKKIRWYHWVILLTALLTFECRSPFLPGYWLREIPAFKSCFVMTRWRFVMALFIALSAAVGVSECWQEKFFSRGRIIALVALSCLALVVNECWTYGMAVPPITEKDLLTIPGVMLPSSREFTTMAFNPSKGYFAVKNNVGNLKASPPVLGYFYETNYAQFKVDDNGYRGELWGDGVSLIKRTPNRFYFTAAGPARVHVNANVSNYWCVSGTRLFPNAKTFEVDKPFEFDVPEAGTYIIYARPMIHQKGLAVTFGAAAVFILLLLADFIVKKHLAGGRKDAAAT